jgi:hypothetical protein
MFRGLLSTTLIVSAILICGCVHTKHIGQDPSEDVLAEMNRELNGREATIYLKDGRKHPGRDIQVNRDSTYWTSLTQDKPVRVSTAEIERIVIIKCGRGGLEGFAIAAAIGIPIGLGLGSAAAGIADREDATPVMINGALIVGGITGFVFGLPIGAAIGSKDKYLFTIPKD